MSKTLKEAIEAEPKRFYIQKCGEGINGTYMYFVHDGVDEPWSSNPDNAKRYTYERAMKIGLGFGHNFAICSDNPNEDFNLFSLYKDSITKNKGK